MANEKEIRRLSTELDHIIKEINQESISQATGAVSKEEFIQVAATVANIRARYLKQVLSFKSTENTIKAEDIKKLRMLREAYEEMMEGFNSLYHALQKGYFELSE